MSTSIRAASDRRAWTGIEVQRARLAGTALTVPARDTQTVVINLGEPFVLARVDGPVRRAVMGTGSVKIVPAGEPSAWRWNAGVTPDVLHLRVPGPFLREVAATLDLNPDTVAITARLGIRDPQLEHVGLSLLAEVHAEGMGGRLYAEALATIVAVHLLRHHAELEPTACPHAEGGGLSPRLLRRVVDYIEERLASDMTLADLAGVAHLSPYHFARLFKRATGLSPHQYVIHRRVERARLLLTATDLALHEIATSVGFADQSHLARHVRRLLGVTPTALRA